LRTLARYMAQGGSPFGLGYAAEVLVRHAETTRALFALFTTRHDPDFSGDRDAAQVDLVTQINEHLSNVTSIGEDQVLRRYREVIEASQRTNYFQRGADGEPHAEIVVKIASPELTWLPQPRPLVEAYLHAPSVEAVHLRGGKVARGGIRWSDRPQDFRTEVLGLAKAQQVKNAVIVPVGAKGGFVPRDADRSLGREAFQEAGITAYKRFVTRMLGITDDLDGDTVVPPERVVRHDGDDPYFVVAADKGTATFSDTANAISQAHGYWLDDAFASGGSAGYDHKAMGITARGGWESVKRHFAEADIDLDKPFTVVGVGDMSGDVFGNGMIYVPTIKLLAAFDHRDIFIDPDPDPETSFAERKRLFEMGRSTWKDYDESLISQGGGIFSRELKAIPLSAQMKDLLDLDGETATPFEVMSAVLKAQADLLWFGGIGTYIRSERESDGDVGDRANDAIRITGTQVRARVIGEGANLGLTQLGRIEAATDDVQGGGEPTVRLNTDAIDNSGGVNSSDLEVNIKIGLQTPEREGRLTREDRNVLLKEMTEEVADLVLANNARQALAVSLVRRRAVSAWGDMARVMQKLEARDLLKRDVEFLPSDSEIAERVKNEVPVSRPEIAVILAYAKIALYDDLIASSVPDDPYLSRELQRYFPTAMQERFPQAIETHRLRREIIATMLANSMINRGGPSLVTQMADRTGAPAANVAFAFALVRDAYGLQALNAGIDQLDTAIPGDLQIALYAQVQELLVTEIAWFLRHGAGEASSDGGLADKVSHYESGIADYRAALDGALDEASRRAIDTAASDLAAKGVPEELAATLAVLPHMARATDVVLVADQAEVSVRDATQVYVEVGRHFHIDRLLDMAAALEPSEHYDRLAIARTRERLEEVQRRLTRAVLRGGETASVADWAKGDVEASRAREAVASIAADTTPTLAKVTVAAGFLADLAVSDA
ncbi:MAG: NAD-glutamate dehydrogenase domain-containing protein, partial [Pseudomonadota bacterium]